MRSKNVKRKVLETALLIIKTETNGIRASSIAEMVSKAHGSRLFGVSVGTLGQMLSPYVANGTIYRSRTVEGNTVYHYNLALETGSHGVET